MLFDHSQTSPDMYYKITFFDCDHSQSCINKIVFRWMPFIGVQNTKDADFTTHNICFQRLMEELFLKHFCVFTQRDF